MAWQSESIVVLRIMIDDWGSPPTFTDARLEQLFLVAAQLVNSEMNFSTTYTVDLDECSLSPDPTTGTKDNNFFNLTCLKAACILDQAQARTAAGRAVQISSFKSSIRLTDVASHRLALLKEGYCKLYAETKLQYELDRASVAGAAIMTPFRTAASDYGSYRLEFR